MALEVFVRIFQAIGGIGLITVSVVYTFFKYATKEQKQYFVDKFLLLKPLDTGNGFPSYLFILLGIFFVILWTYYYLKLKLAKERINELAAERNKLQGMLYGSENVEFHSSKPNKS